MRILDPSGAATDWLKKNFPDALVESVVDEEQPYDAAVLSADFDNACDPEARLAAVAQHVRRPGGRIFVNLPEGIKGNQRTPGRRRSWRSVDVADLLRCHGRLEEFAVDDDGYINAVMEPVGKKREIAVWTGYAIGPWHPMDILNRGLGGSETAAYRLAEVLAEMGYIVTLYGHFNQEGAIKDVILRDWKTFDPTEERLAVICFRNAEMFDMPVNAATKILWLEDVAGAEGLNEQRAENLDYVVGVSQWHAQNIKDVYPWLPEEKVLGMRNGIKHEYFDGEAPEREPRVLYTSSPDRGLDIVLECWPKVLEQVPDAVFAHLYGPWYDLVADRAPAITAHRQRIRELSEQPGVKTVGSLGQKDLALLMRSSLVWVHPEYFSVGGEKFNETSCISAMEAQAAGLVVVCADWGALSETVQVGMKLDGDPMSEEWRDRFVAGIVKGLTDERTQHIAQTEGPKVVGYNDWYGVAIELQNLWSNRALVSQRV
jgi:glycosyltransferase involved in cell wall biosynthesis